MKFQHNEDGDASRKVWVTKLVLGAGAYDTLGFCGQLIAACRGGGDLLAQLKQSVGFHGWMKFTGSIMDFKQGDEAVVWCTENDDLSAVPENIQHATVSAELMPLLTSWFSNKGHVTYTTDLEEFEQNINGMNSTLMSIYLASTETSEFNPLARGKWKISMSSEVDFETGMFDMAPEIVAGGEVIARISDEFWTSRDTLLLLRARQMFDALTKIKKLAAGSDRPEMNTVSKIAGDVLASTKKFEKADMAGQPWAGF